MDGVAKIAPVVAMYAGRDDMLEKVEQVVRATQESDFIVVVALAAARWDSQFNNIKTIAIAKQMISKRVHCINYILLHIDSTDSLFHDTSCVLSEKYCIALIVLSNKYCIALYLLYCIVLYIEKLIVQV